MLARKEPIVALLAAVALLSTSCSTQLSHAAIIRPSSTGQQTLGATSRTLTPLLWIINGTTMSAFDLSQSGNVPPVRIVEGPSTFGALSPVDLAGGPHGEIYVLGNISDQHGITSWQIDRFPARANGNTPPASVINCTLPPFVGYIAVGAHGEVAITASSPDQQSPEVYIVPSNSDGCPPGIRTIVGPNTGLTFPWSIAIGPQGAVYVLNGSNGLHQMVEIFGRDHVGDVPPDRLIEGPHTKLFTATSLAVDGAGYIYVSNIGDNSINVYRPSANGDATPVRRIRGTNTQLYQPYGLAIAPDGRLFVDNTQNQVITIYSAGADGNAAPIQTIGGSATGIQGGYITIAPN